MNIQEEIKHLKKEKDAVILAHYYVDAEVQKIADYIGDSYYLSKMANSLPQKTIVFCGVSFMGESAKILNPDKVVLMPDAKADCPMAHMAKIEEIKKIQEAHEDLATVCYINSTAELKTLSDVCVTSSNAVKIVKNLPQKNIFFIPDKNLGHYVAEQVPEKNFIFNDGFCPIHDQISSQGLKELKEKYPEAEVLAHPECPQDVLAEADFIGSTSGIIRFATESSKQIFIICTEEGILYKLKEGNPDKTFIFPEPSPICRDMKFVTLEKVLDVLKNRSNEVFVDSEVAKKAVLCLNRMLELAE